MSLTHMRPVCSSPIYGIHSVGDSDCYHNDRHGNSTQVVLAVADKYREHNMPGAWFLPNDGCNVGDGLCWKCTEHIENHLT